MSLDSTDRKYGEENSGSEHKTIGFWSSQLKSGRIIQAIRSYSTEARRFFGALPVMRENILELSLILDAHKTLKMSDARLNKTHNKFRKFALDHLRKLDPSLTVETIEKDDFYKENYASHLRQDAKLRLTKARGKSGR